MLHRLRPHLSRLTLLTTLVVAAALAFFSTRPLFAQPPAAASTFTCTPYTVGVFAQRIHVRCTTPADPGNAIYYFAFCTANDAALGARYLSAMTAAKATGKDLLIYYTPDDLSAAGCGCATSDCRTFVGLEIRS
jgi:hypothetical protein